MFAPGKGNRAGIIPELFHLKGVLEPSLLLMAIFSYLLGENKEVAQKLAKGRV